MRHAPGGSSSSCRISYFGGKVRASRWILPLLPPLPNYADLFGGSAAMLLNRPRAEGREIYNDLSEGMAALMAELRDAPKPLIWRLRFTLYSRVLYNEAKDRIRARAAQAADAEMIQAQSIFAGGDDGAAWGINRGSRANAHPTTGRHGVSVGDAPISADAAHVSGAATFAHPAAGWGCVKNSGVRAQSKTEADRHGVGDAGAVFTVACDSHSSKSGGLRVTKQPVNDAGVKEQAASQAGARKQGLARDVAAEREASVNGEGGWKRSVDGETIGAIRHSTQSERQGLASDVLYSRDATINGVDASGWNHKLEPTRTGGGSASRRQGIANDMMPARDGALHGNDKGGWRRNVQEDKKRVPQKHSLTLDGERQRGIAGDTAERLFGVPRGERIYGGYARTWEDTPLARCSKRLDGVEVYMEDALTILAELAQDETFLIYLDPPYEWSSRTGSSDYMHEMDGDMHRKMLTLIQNAKAHIAISGYGNPLYDEMLADWERHEQEVTAGSALGLNGSGDAERAKRTEVVWCNYRIDDWRPRQGGLF